MSFKRFLEINLNSREVIIEKGEILYHGTSESFDTRTLKPGGDGIFWTTDDIMIARTYIPRNGSSSSTSLQSILRDEQHKNIRKSIGLTNKIISFAWEKDRKGYEMYKYWDDKYKEFSKKCKELESIGDLDSLDDAFFVQWMEAEQKRKESLSHKKAEDYLKSFVITKMKTFGYEPTGYSGDYFTKILTDNDGNLLPSSTRTIGKVLEITCKRDFKFYNYALGKEGDLMEPDHRKYGLFKQIEEDGYDGIIINDYAQSEYHGNYGHISFGFFKSSLKDLSSKQIRSQTHPSEEEWS